MLILPYCKLQMYPGTASRIYSPFPRLPTLKYRNCRGISVIAPSPALSATTNKSILTITASISSRSITSFLTLGRVTDSADPDATMVAGKRATFMAAGAALALLVLPAMAAASPEEMFVKKTVAAHDVVIFSKSYCPYCRRAKAVFKELNKVPHVVELDERDDGQDIQDALSVIVGRRTVPQVFINGKHLGGSDDTVEAYESGRLSELLGIESQEL